MKKIYLSCIFLLLFSASVHSQAVEGIWDGNLSIAGMKLKIKVTLKPTGDSLTGTIDIPQQNVKGLKLSSVVSTDSLLRFEIRGNPAGTAYFEGKIFGDSISGTLNQAGYKGDFSVKRTAAETVREAIPEILPYLEEEVVFYSDSVKIAGTLSKPKESGIFPAIVLISGSGQQNRDEEIFGFKIFRKIADYLTRRGIAVLRYDDRGIGGSETGNLEVATTLDFSKDAAAAVKFLSARKDMDNKRIVIFGHSEGAIIASMLASRNPQIAGIILMSGSAISGDSIILYQIRSLMEENDASAEEIESGLEIQRLCFEAARTDTGWDTLTAKLKEEARKQIEQLSDEDRKNLGEPEELLNKNIDVTLNAVKTQWFKYFISYNPAAALEKVRCPVLALFGAKDKQVPVEMNKPPLEAALKKAGNKDITVKIFENANHLYQDAKTGSVSEYIELEKEFTAGFLEFIGQWLTVHNFK